MYTDHSAAVSIVRQTSLNTTSTEKLNLRLIRASEYIQRFHLDVRYKPGKTNTVPDALSRLASREFRPTEEARSKAYQINCYPATLVELSPEFKQRVIAGYLNGPFARILRVLRGEETATAPATLPYQIEGDLLYFKDDTRGLRLCIPEANSDEEEQGIEAEIFRMAHDELGHPGYARTYERLTQSVYIHNMGKKLHEFIRHCPQCQANQTPRHRPYGALQPILSPPEPFNTLTIDLSWRCRFLPKVWTRYYQ